MSALLSAGTAAGALADIGNGLRESLRMLYESGWALVLGFSVSGAAQAFVSRAAMRRSLGDHGPAAVLRAALLGAVSSSCSYAAAATARSLYARGADFVTAMVFMFASTNLVVELGIVLVVLIGWQFALAEYAGGVVMIVLLAGFGSLAFAGRRFRAALASRRDVEAAAGGGREGAPTDAPVAWTAALAGRAGWTALAGRAGWTSLAGYALSDLNMLWKEILTGYLVAGQLAADVPVSAWNDLFLHGHGVLTELENVLVGPLVAFVSFVCSIGNVPLAAALWHGGISFAGVVSFLFADLLSAPLVLVYAKLYGRRVALRLMVVFWLVMSASGLVTEGLLSALGWLPTRRPALAPGGSFSGPTAILDVVFAAVLAALLVLHARRGRFDGGADAVDPACGMRVHKDEAPAVAQRDGRTYYFCSEACRTRFEDAQTPTRK